MYKKASLNLVLATSLALPNYVLAADEATSEQIQNGVANLSLDNILQNSKVKSLAEKVDQYIDKLCAPIDKNSKSSDQQRAIDDKNFLSNNDLQKYKTEDSRLMKEFSRYRIKISVDPLENLIDTKHLFGGIEYQYIVEPAFRNNEQIRKDIWVFPIGLRASTGNIGASVTATVRITFSRFYGGKQAKWNAIRACPYVFTYAPTNTNDIKTKLRDGDGVRFEVLGTTALSTGKVVDIGIDANAYAGAKTEALFLMDLYKLNNRVARTRLMGIKNKGEVSLGFTVKNTNPLEFIRGKLRDALTLGLTGNLRKSFSFLSPSEEYPLDTMMVDYLFRFSTPDPIEDLDAIKNRTDIAESAMEELLTNIKKIGFSSLFFSVPGKNLSRDQAFGRNLLEKVKKAEDLAKEDLQRYRENKIEEHQMRVRSFFKGRMESNLFAGDGKLWFSEVISKKGQIGNLNSFVTSFDENMQPHYYYLNNTFERAQTRKYLGRQQHNYTHDFDILINSDVSRQTGRISDIILRTQIQDTDLSKEDLQVLKDSLARSLPANFKNDPKFHNFFPTTDQNNAFLSHRYVFGHEAFKAISRYDKNNLGQMLHDFLDTHPDRKMMHLKPDETESTVGLGTYALEKAYEINNIISPEIAEYDIRQYPEIPMLVKKLEEHGYKTHGFLVTKEISEEDLRSNPELLTYKRTLEAYGNEKSKSAFKIAKREPIFAKYIVGEFFASILPEDISSSLFGLNLKITSRELGEPPAIDLGNKKVSSVYEAVSFLKAVISDPNLDMQLVGSMDHSGDEGLKPSTGSLIGLPARDSKP